MGKEDFLGLRPLNEVEMGYLRTSKFYATAILNRFIAMKRDAAALDCGSEGDALNLRTRIRGLIIRAGLSRWLGAVARGSSLIIFRATDEELPAFTEEMEKALNYSPTHRRDSGE